MRERSETIYAQNEDNYKEIMNSIDSRRERIKTRKNKKFFNEEIITEELNCFQNYNLTIIEPTIEEKEREDEQILLNAIENLNRKKFKNKFEKKLCSELIIDKLQDNLDSDLQILISNESLNGKISEFSGNHYIQKDSLISKLSLSKISTEANTLSLGNSQMEAIINQNFTDFEHIFKIIVIGDKGVGKTLFIERFVSGENVNKMAKQIYTPTECLEIKKTFTKILNINTKIELWDTNLSILNSAIIKTYLKISNGFVLIADYNRVDSITFLEKQIENILNTSNSHNEILFVINKKFVYDGFTTKDIYLVDSKIKYLKEKFDISPIFLNLSEYWLGLNNYNTQSIMKFLENIMINKIGKISKAKQKTASIKTFTSKSPTKIKKISNTNKNSPNRIEVSKCMNITQKRTRSVKKTLNDILEKLKLENI